MGRKRNKQSNAFGTSLVGCDDPPRVPCRTLEEYYHINANTFEKQYKDHLSGFRDWEQLSHSDRWIVFPENIG